MLWLLVRSETTGTQWLFFTTATAASEMLETLLFCGIPFSYSAQWAPGPS